MTDKQNNPNKPVYISLTSIFQRQHLVLRTLESIVKQTTLPSKIFLFLSKKPHLLDAGFKDKLLTNNNLKIFLHKYSHLINVVWVKNIGPYRKLIPLLKKKWDEDCIIITIDDDTEYDNKLIENLVNDYKEHNCVINYRGFSPKISKIEELEYKKDKYLMNKHLFNFPTGKGGILYTPSFFHKTKELIFNKDIYLKKCETADDVWFMLVRVANNVSCFLDNKPFMKKDNNCNSLSLFSNYNNNNNKNTEIIKKTLKALKEKGYFK